MEAEFRRDDETGRFVEGNRPPNPSKSPHSPERQAVIVAFAEATGASEAAEVSEVPRRTIRRWAADAEVLPDGSHPVPPANRELARAVLADEAEKIVRQYMTHLQLDAVVQGASARDAATVVGILVDKSIKLRGEDKPSPLDQPLSLGDYLLSLAAQAKARSEAP